jgi:Na+/H+-dicarboxylate symporter
MTQPLPSGRIPGKQGKSWLASLTVRSLGGLGLGLLLGLMLLQRQPAWGATVLQITDALVRAWTNAFRVLVAPLIISQLYLALARGRSQHGEIRRLGFATPVVFAGLLVLTTLVSAAVTVWLLRLPWLAGLSMPQSAGPSVAAAVQTGNGGASWVDDFIPPNLFAAAAADNILPLMVFTVAFALAARRLATPLRDSLQRGFTAVSGAALLLVEWLILATPVAIFAMGLSSAARAGLSIGGALLAFTGLDSAALLISLLVLYPVVVVLGGVSIRWFARSMWPAQLTAITTRSSLATIPALLASAEASSGPAAVFASYVLPLAGAVLKLSRAVSGPVKLLFLAHLLSIPLTAERIAIFIVTIILLSPTTMGVPRVTSGTRSLPAYVAAGIPPEYVVLLGATTAVTDVFMTVLNSTGYMAANVLIGRFAAGAVVAKPEPNPTRWAEGEPAGEPR